MCDGCVSGQGAKEGWARLCHEDLQQAAVPMPWQPALILPSLRGPVLSCPEVLHCAQLGAAQYKMRRGGRQRGASKLHSPPSAPCTVLTGLLHSQNSQGPTPELSSRQSLVFCLLQKAGPARPPGPAEVLSRCFSTYLSTWTT